MSTSRRVLIKHTPSSVTQTQHHIFPTQSLTPSHATNLLSTPVYSPTIPVLPSQSSDARVTIVALLSSCCVILLIVTFLILIVCIIGRKIKLKKLKTYSNFPKEERILVEKETKFISEDNSKYNPIYVSGDSIRGREDFSEIHSIRPGNEVEATQDYFQPGRERDGPVFFKGDRILVQDIEGSYQKDPSLVWLRGYVEDRHVFFPSYVVQLVDTFDDTFDTFTTPVRGAAKRVSQLESLTAHDSAVSIDSAPAELESLFHDVDYTLAPHSNAIPLLSREVVKQRHYSHSDISHHKPIKRPNRRPPLPPSIQTPVWSIPRVPSKLNRPKLSTKNRGSKDTNELVFVPPPLSSSTPVKHPTPPKHTKRIRPFMPRRQRRPDTPDTKMRPEHKLTINIPSWIEPMDFLEAPTRPDPPYTPSTLSLLLYAGSQDNLPDKPPPPNLYDIPEPDLGKTS